MATQLVRPMSIEIPSDLANRLEEVARQHGLTVLELLAAMQAELENKTPYATLADMAANAAKAGLRTPHPVDTAARSREILETEYMDYLTRRRAP